MSAFSFIVSKLFRHQDMNQLEEYNMLHILQTYSNALYKHYMSLKIDYLEVGDIVLIEFVCIRIIYMALNMDEMCSNNRLYNMPHTDIHIYVPKAWPSPKTIVFEYDILSICDWNPLRFCKLICDDMEIGSPLWDNEKVEIGAYRENLTENFTVTT